MGAVQEHGAHSRDELRRNIGWTVLSLATSFALVLSFFNLYDGIIERDWLAILGWPGGAAFCCWIIGGAWLRTTWGTAQRNPD